MLMAGYIHVHDCTCKCEYLRISQLLIIHIVIVSEMD